MRLHATFSEKISAKLTKALLVFFLLVFIIVCRLVQLQVIMNMQLFKRSQRNFLRTERINSPRGNIVDRNGKLLATNIPTFYLYWRGSGNTTLSAEQRATLKTIETILEKPLLDDADFMRNLARNERLHREVLLASELRFDQLSKLKEQLSEQQNVFIVNNFKRHYPYSTFASHILGYLVNIDTDMAGKMGLEKMFEDTLRGQQGQMLKIINSCGRNFASTEVTKALAGQNLTTTLDVTMQGILENLFPDDVAGTAIVMNPENGAILGLVSRPHFEPGLFLSAISHDDWKSLQEKKPFLNRAFNALYPPGSLFKLISMSAALETNIINQDSHCNCRGYTTFADRRYWCARHHGHGNICVQQALAYSCNVLFFEIAKVISIDTLADYARRFGLGKQTNIIFPEKTGIVPDSAWKRATKGEPWWPGETLSAIIGQSFYLVTPIQMARMMSGICTGHLPTPRIIEDEIVQTTPLRISEETREFLRQSMKKVVKRGTGIRVNSVRDIEVYAKTSTAQISSLAKRELDSRYLEHGWFAGFFQYKDLKPLTLVIITENSGTTRIATNYAKNFLIAYKKQVDSGAFQSFDTV